VVHGTITRAITLPRNLGNINLHKQGINSSLPRPEHQTDRASRATIAGERELPATGGDKTAYMMR
jgi:hypothetical protein